MKPLALHNKGFTLLELMIVVAMITIMASIAVPEFSRWVEKQRLASDARSIHGLLQAARSHAIETGNPVVVTFSKGKGESGTYRAFSDPNGNGSQDNGEKSLASGHVSRKTELSEASFDPNGSGKLTATQTVFDGMGLATGRNGMVTVKDTYNRTATISLGPAGTTSISTGN